MSTNPKKLRLTILEGKFAICRFDKKNPIPDWAMRGNLWSLTRTRDELSIICREENLPKKVTCEKGWQCLKVEGPLDFSLVGILASLATPLAEEGISIFAISTYETDYLFIKKDHLNRALKVLSKQGFEIRR